MARREYYTATDDQDGTRRPHRYADEQSARIGAKRKANTIGRSVTVRLHLDDYSYIVDTITPDRSQSRSED